MGMASTAGLNSLAHSLTFGINLAVFTNLAQYMYTDTKLRRFNEPTHLRKWGPFYCILGATIGVMADLIRHLINDANNWFLVARNGYKLKFDFENCDYVIPQVTGLRDQCKAAGIGPLTVTEENALGISLSMYNDDGSLSVYGWLFTIVGTWTGIALLFIGVFWYANIGAKLRRQFVALRGRQTNQLAVQNDDVQQAFLTPISSAAIEEANSGFLTPLSDPGTPR